MKKKSLWIVFCVIVTAALLAGPASGLFSKNNRDDSPSRKSVTVTRRDINASVIATGIIEPTVGAEVRVGSRISGIVKQLYTNIGDPVKKGDLLAELDPVENKARFNQAAAALTAANADLDYARLDLKRKQVLLKEKFASQDNVDTAQQAFTVAKAQLEETRANLEYAKIQLGYTKIFAPIGGVVASVSTQEGETVAAGFATPTFVTIIDLDRLEVQAYVDETDIGRIEEGQHALFTVDTYPATDFKGKVTAVYPQAEIKDNVVNYITVIRITGTNGKILRPEMTTSVTILLKTRENVLTVPNKTIHREKGRKFVYVPGKQTTQTTRKRWVKTGWKDRYYTEIIDGLKENEKVTFGGD
ncbi:MAG: efflux RND transporter periplasmic adaptor subunit [bacterium]|nr:efflux RND transporter periplasmic adaptor subunit [bacterium]